MENLESTQKGRFGNYVKQANFLTSSIFLNMKEVQKDILYFLMQNIDYHSANPKSKITIDFNKFLEYKNTIKNNFYSFKETVELLEEMIETKGSFRNQYTGEYVVFNLIDSVSANPNNPNQLDVNLAKYGQIFLYEKLLSAYVDESRVLLPNNNSGLGYTQIEKNVVTLGSYPQKKLFEMLSRFKSKGFLKISVTDLKMALGFIEFVSKNIDVSEEEIQLQLVFSKDDSNLNYERIERFTKFNEFKRNFLDRAVTAINDNFKLDITNLKYETLRTGKKISHIHFTFKKVMNLENMNDQEKICNSHFINFGLQENQILFLLNRIGHEIMYKKFNDKIDRKKTIYGVKYFDKVTDEEIKNLAGFLYDNVFEELK